MNQKNSYSKYLKALLKTFKFQTTYSCFVQIFSSLYPTIQLKWSTLFKSNTNENAWNVRLNLKAQLFACCVMKCSVLEKKSAKFALLKVRESWQYTLIHVEEELESLWIYKVLKFITFIRIKLFTRTPRIEINMAKYSKPKMERLIMILNWVKNIMIIS